MDILRDIGAAFVFFLIAVATVWAAISIVMSASESGQHQSDPAGPGCERGRQAEAEAATDESARQAARAEAQESDW